MKTYKELYKELPKAYRDKIEKEVSLTSISKICNINDKTIKSIKERNGLIYKIVQTKQIQQ